MRDLTINTLERTDVTLHSYFRNQPLRRKMHGEGREKGWVEEKDHLQARHGGREGRERREHCSQGSYLRMHLVKICPYPNVK
jgi:hypothetical protein